jgi:pimeloyl-ACP methyl ester carboxylesterase
MRRGSAAVLFAFALTAATGGATATSAAGSPPVPVRTEFEVDIPPPTLAWGECRFHSPPAECATVPLPLDYDDPTGPTTRIGVLRVPATGDKIGTLFVNPGGPGGVATDFAPFAASLIGPGVARHFDIVGIDPRGVGMSGFSWCRADIDESALEAKFGTFPVTRAETRLRLRADRLVDEGCAEHRAAIVDHASTADDARDMDVIRQALGEEQLSYYGISYGSLLGQTYAAMFPDRVRAMIVDGVLHPVEWTAGNDPQLPVSYRLRSGRGAYEALTSALFECNRVGRARCPVAGHATGAWLHAVRAARAGRLVVDGEQISYQSLIDAALGSLYDVSEIHFLFDFLASVGRDAAQSRTASIDAGRAWRELARNAAERDAIGPYALDYGQVVRARGRLTQLEMSFEAVLCGDSVNPASPRRWVGTSRLADKRQPWFGRLWTWASSSCAQWPGRAGEDAFRGPWNTATSYPLLIVANAHDPATPISGARAANRFFADSVLLLLNTWGHGALDSGPCIRERMAAYLIDRDVPRAGTVCRPSQGPFSQTGDRGSAAEGDPATDDGEG